MVRIMIVIIISNIIIRILWSHPQKPTATARVTRVRARVKGVKLAVPRRKPKWRWHLPDSRNIDYVLSNTYRFFWQTLIIILEKRITNPNYFLQGMFSVCLNQEFMFKTNHGSIGKTQYVQWKLPFRGVVKTVKSHMFRHPNILLVVI